MHVIHRPRPTPVVRNEGMLAATLRRIADGPTAEQYCRTILDWVHDCEEDRLARTGQRRLPGFER